MRLGPVLATVACAAGVTVSACSLISTPPTARSLANKIGCTDFSPEQQAGSYSHDIGGCYLNSSSYLTIFTFTSNDVRNQWLEIARQGGVSPALIVSGNLWAVRSDPAGVSAVQKILGGQIGD